MDMPINISPETKLKLEKQIESYGRDKLISAKIECLKIAATINTFEPIEKAKELLAWVLEEKLDVKISSIMPDISQLLKRAKNGEDPNELLKEIEPKFTID